MTGAQPESRASTSFPPCNPFSTRAVRPGTLVFQFPPGDSLTQCVSRFRDHHWWGEIVGPHGSGKSTLVESLRPALTDAGRKVIAITLASGQRRLPETVAAACVAWDDTTQLIVDGYEQLGWWSRRSLKQTCRQRGSGLLITAHRSFGFPPLLATTTSLEQTQQLVVELLAHHTSDRISSADVADAFARHHGNVREVFFDLYDRYEGRA